MGKEGDKLEMKLLRERYTKKQAAKAAKAAKVLKPSKGRLMYLFKLIIAAAIYGGMLGLTLFIILRMETTTPLPSYVDVLIITDSLTNETPLLGRVIILYILLY